MHLTEQQCHAVAPAATATALRSTRKSNLTHIFVTPSHLSYTDSGVGSVRGGTPISKTAAAITAYPKNQCSSHYTGPCAKQKCLIAITRRRNLSGDGSCDWVTSLPISGHASIMAPPFGLDLRFRCNILYFELFLLQCIINTVAHIRRSERIGKIMIHHTPLCEKMCVHVRLLLHDGKSYYYSVLRRKKGALSKELLHGGTINCYAGKTYFVLGPKAHTNS